MGDAGLTRRSMLKRIAAGAAGSVALAGCATDRGRPKAALRPNIVLILADDLGWSDIGCYGGEIDTPNLDRLAAEGLRFTQFYNCARCCPTRASLLTGLYPHQTGIGHMTDPEFDYGRPGYRGHLNRECITLAEGLKRGGYHTLMAGKWHVGRQPGMWPVDRGFDEYYGILHGASNYFKMNEDAGLARNGRLVESEGDNYYTTDAFTDYAVQFIDDYAGRGNAPYFLFMSYTAPHFPLHAPPEDIAKYRGKYRIGWDEVRRRRHERQKALALIREDCPLSPRDPAVEPWEEVENEDEWDLPMAVYAAMVDRMDRNIGRILEAVRRSGEEENTLILFLSDNGACSEPINVTPGIPPGPAESIRGYDVGWANACNTPFRRFKHWAHEGGIATPLIARWPRVIGDRNGITDQVGHVIDFMPTFLEAAGVEYPDAYNGNSLPPLEGQSLLPAFRAEKAGRREPLFWEHEGNRAVRVGDWKLVSEFSDLGTYLDFDKDITIFSGDWELYNLREDRVELNNLAARQPDRVAHMAALYDDWARTHRVEPWEELLPQYRETLRRQRGGG